MGKVDKAKLRAMVIDLMAQDDLPPWLDEATNGGWPGEPVIPGRT